MSLSNYSLNFGPYSDFETTLASKLFFISLNYAKTSLIHNIDFRFSYGISNAQNNLKNYLQSKKNLFLLFTNLRFESPLLNLRVRELFCFPENNIYLIGFLSNYNYNFVHFSSAINTYLKRFLLTKQDASVFFNNITYLLNTNGCTQNKIAGSVSEISSNELNCPATKLEEFSNLQFNLGQPESFPLTKSQPLSLNFLHNIEDVFVSNLQYLNPRNLLLPTKFYYEKKSLYAGSTFNFFDTVCHYNLSLATTKDD